MHFTDKMMFYLTMALAKLLKMFGQALTIKKTENSFQKLKNILRMN